jgi:hypothetical protein
MVSFVYVISSSGVSRAHLAVFEYPMRFTRYDYFLHNSKAKGDRAQVITTLFQSEMHTCTCREVLVFSVNVDFLCMLSYDLCCSFFSFHCILLVKCVCPVITMLSFGINLLYLMITSWYHLTLVV